MHSLLRFDSLVPRLRARLASLALAALVAALGPGTAWAQTSVTHVCEATVADGYGRPIPNALVRFSIREPGMNTPILYQTEGRTGSDGSLTLSIPWEDESVYMLCKTIAGSVEHRVRRTGAGKLYREGSPAGGSLVVAAEVAPAWAQPAPSFPGLKPGDGKARLYQSGAYDKVVIIPEGMDFGEQDPDLIRDADRFWFTYADALKPLYALGYDVWLFEPFKTGQNIHEQTAEFAQAIRHAATAQGGAWGGKVIVAGYSLGGIVARLTTARWQADPAWRGELGLPEDLPAHLVAFGDAPLEGANASTSIRGFLWEKHKQGLFNVNSCAAQQLLLERCEPPDCEGGSSQERFFETGEVVWFFDREGVCDYVVGGDCRCEAGPPVLSVNGDGFVHGIRKVAFAAGQWSPNQCYGGARDENSHGADLCPRDPGGQGAFTPTRGDIWGNFRTDCGLGERAFATNEWDVAPGSRFPVAFESLPAERDILHDADVLAKLIGFLANCDTAWIEQNWAFTFIPTWSALAANTPGGIPFDAWETATYNASHDKPPEALLSWLFDRFDEVYAQGPPPPPPPGVPPAAPTDVKAIPVVGGYDQVKVTWKDQSFNEDGFRVYRLRSGPGQTPKLIATVDANETSYLDTVPFVPEPPAGTAYYFYRIRSFNDAGEGISERAEARLFGEAPPGVPSNLNPRLCIDTLRPTFTWKGTPLSSQYYVRVLDAETGDEAIPDMMPQHNEVLPSGSLKRGRPYMFRVRGMNNHGTGPWSDFQHFMPFCQPMSPPVPQEPLGCTESLTPTLGWSPVTGALFYVLHVWRVVGDPSYDVLISDPEGLGVSGTTLRLDPGLLREPLRAGQEYRFAVKAHNGGAPGPRSTLRYFTPLCSPNAGAGTASPLAPGGIINTGTPTYHWEVARGAEEYQLIVGVLGGPVLAQPVYAANSACPGRECSATPLMELGPGGYYWYVRARNAFNNGVWGPLSHGPHFTVPQLAALSVGEVTMTEGTGGTPMAVVPLTLSEATTIPIQVRLAPVAGTATPGKDFVAQGVVANLVPGATAGAAQFPVMGDAAYEWNESFGVQVTSVEGAKVRDGEGLVLLQNDDAAPRLVAQDWWVQGNEGENGGRLPVSLEGSTELPVHVRYAVSECTAREGVDYVSDREGELSFPVGTTNATVSFQVLPDSLPEGHEIVKLTLSEPQGAAINDGVGQATIVDDDLPRPGRPRADFDGDGKGDILWRNTSSGALVVWQLVGVNRRAASPLDPGALSDFNWGLAGIADFNGSGGPDLVWHNAVSGRLSFWLMNGLKRVEGRLVEGIPDTSWKVAGTGRLNADGHSDLVWRNGQDGRVRLWLLQGTTLVEDRPLDVGPYTDPGWELVGIGDLDRDGQDDLLWRWRGATGAIQPGALEVSFVADGQVVRTEALTPNALADPNWEAVGIWDVDEDGHTDVVWSHRTSRKVVVWLMNGTTRTCGATLNPDRTADGNWKLVGPR